METSLIIILSLFVLFVVYLINTDIRNNKTYRLKIKMIDMCHEYTLRHTRDDDWEKGWVCYDELPSYSKMVFFSLKPLKIEKWFTKEQIELLNS